MCAGKIILWSPKKFCEKISADEWQQNKFIQSPCKKNRVKILQEWNAKCWNYCHMWRQGLNSGKNSICGVKLKSLRSYFNVTFLYLFRKLMAKWFLRNWLKQSSASCFSSLFYQSHRSLEFRSIVKYTIAWLTKLLTVTVVRLGKYKRVEKICWTFIVLL